MGGKQPEKTYQHGKGSCPGSSKRPWEAEQEWHRSRSLYHLVKSDLLPPVSKLIRGLQPFSKAVLPVTKSPEHIPGTNFSKLSKVAGGSQSYEIYNSLTSLENLVPFIDLHTISRSFCENINHEPPGAWMPPGSLGPALSRWLHICLWPADFSNELRRMSDSAGFLSLAGVKPRLIWKMMNEYN